MNDIPNHVWEQNTLRTVSECSQEPLPNFNSSTTNLFNGECFTGDLLSLFPVINSTLKKLEFGWTLDIQWFG